MLKIAVVGCGKIADGHVEEIQKLVGCKLVAVCDREPLMAEQLASRYSVPNWYSDLERMLAEQTPDVLHITTPPQSHLAIGKLAADAGCHLYVEKPLAMDANEAQDLIDHVGRRNRKLTINYWPNFDPVGQMLDDMVSQDILGDAIHIESYLGYDLSGAYGNALLSDPRHWVHQLPGKLFHNTLDHVVNKIVKFLPDAETTVQALGYRRRAASGDPVADSLLDELRFTVTSNNVSASGIFTCHAKPVAHFARIHATKNTVHVDYNSRIITTDADVRYPSALGRLEPAFSQARKNWRAGMSNVRLFRKYEFGYFAGMGRLIGLFYDCILNGSEPPISYRDILRVALLMDQIFTQVPQHRSVP